MKTGSIIISLCTATLLLAGCSKDDSGQPGADGTAAQFTTGIDTRTSNEGNNWAAGDAVGVYMKTASQTLGAATPLADNRQYTASAAGVSSALAPAAGETIYYPNDGSAVDFIAYHPWRATGSGAGEINGYLYPIDLTDQSTPALIDLLYSNDATGIARSTTAVPMTFNHALSKLRVNIVKGTAMVDGDFTGMTTTVTGMPLVGSLALADGTTFTGVTMPNLPLPALTTAASGAIASFEAIVIPQAASAYPSRSIYIALAGGDLYQYNLPDANTLPAGKVATYNITVSATGITVSAPTITKWEGTTATPTPGGTTERFRVGDYYPDPNATFTAGVLTSGVAPIGIVYWLDAPVLGNDNIFRSTKGKIVSLDEENTDHGDGRYGVSWDDGDYDVSAANSTTDGRANMAAVSAYITANSKTWSNFPAFKWVVDKNGVAGVNGPWYLPAKNELPALHTSREAVNATLSLAGGTTLSTLTWPYYWSSSQDNDAIAWAGHFVNGFTFFNVKSYPFRVRAVLAF